ncbi:MAG: hypothetical protein R3B47_11370 [Bacteroidia bacterium]
MLNLLARESNIWGIRLSPHGDFRAASEALMDYSRAFNEKHRDGYKPEKTISANWTALGPTGLPSGSNTAKGVGQIHRLAFDPGYNGSTNRIVYAGSVWGGLWRSEDDGVTWSVVNTDVQLPISSVSGIGIHPTNNQTIYIATGDGDYGAYLASSNMNGTGSRATPLFTAGVYRSTNYGTTWQAINGSGNFLINELGFGHTIRMLRVDPNNGARVFITTSNGIYRSTNATSSTPGWSKVTSGITDDQFIGLEFHPNTSATMYASGNDVYQSTNSGGSFSSITGPGTGLDLNNLPGGNSTVLRIGIAVSADAPNDLWAYIVCDDPTVASIGKRIFVYRRSGGSWTMLENFSTTSAFDNLSIVWTAIAVSPTNADKIYIGHTKVRGSDNGGSTWAAKSPYLQRLSCRCPCPGLSSQCQRSGPVLRSSWRSEYQGHFQHKYGWLDIQMRGFAGGDDLGI